MSKLRGIPIKVDKKNIKLIYFQQATLDIRIMLVATDLIRLYPS